MDATILILAHTRPAGTPFLHTARAGASLPGAPYARRARRDTTNLLHASSRRTIMRTTTPTTTAVARRGFLLGTSDAAGSLRAPHLGRSGRNRPGLRPPAAPSQRALDHHRRAASPVAAVHAAHIPLIAGRGLTFTNGYTLCPGAVTLGRRSCRASTPTTTGASLTTSTRSSSSCVWRRHCRDRMKAAGYTTGYFGMYMNGHAYEPTYVAPGWDHWVVRFTKAQPLRGGRRVAAWSPRTRSKAEAYAADKCIDFVRSRAGARRPWFAVFAPTAPHRPYSPSREHRHDFDDVAWDPPAFNESSMRDKAEFLRRLEDKNRELDAPHLGGRARGAARSRRRGPAIVLGPAQDPSDAPRRHHAHLRQRLFPR